MPGSITPPLAAFPPRIIAVVDTEEEFDWSVPYSRESTSVRHMQDIGRLQSVFESFGILPVYVVDYPVASQEQAWRPLRGFVESGRAFVGAHLHPWVTPPFEEKLCARNSYHGNLPKEMEAAKIFAVTNQIERSFGVKPAVFKAGRYGIGPNTYGILAALGYQIDQSPAPPLDFTSDGGPDFSGMSSEPFQDGASGLLVLPGTGGFMGWWPGNRYSAYRWATTSWRSTFHAFSPLSRSRAVRRACLSPEVTSLSDMIALTKSLVRHGQRVFILALHSPSVMPGGTPFASDESGVMELLGRLRAYFEFFFRTLGGESWTPHGVYEYWSSRPDWKAGRAAAHA